MAKKKRTKKQKLQAKTKLELSSNKKITANPSQPTSSYFGFDISLIYKDLIKTVVVTLVILGVLLLIFIYT